MKHTLILTSIFALIGLSGCTNTTPNPSVIGGEINPNSKIPKCGHGWSKSWILKSGTIEPVFIQNKMHTHTIGTGTQQSVCRKKNGNIIFLVSRGVDINETKLTY